MSYYLSYIWPVRSQMTNSIPLFDSADTTVAVAESITAGALANILCSEPGASKYFKGSIVSYSRESNKEILGVDVSNAENTNFANPFTTAEMARKAATMFKARIGLSTTGYSLPMFRPENKEKGECELDIKSPYAYICLYDQLTGSEVITRIDIEYDPKGNKSVQRAQVQAKVSLKARQIYNDYVAKIKLRT